MALIDANWRYPVSQKGSMSLHLTFSPRELSFFSKLGWLVLVWLHPQKGWYMRTSIRMGLPCPWVEQDALVKVVVKRTPFHARPASAGKSAAASTSLLALPAPSAEQVLRVWYQRHQAHLICWSLALLPGKNCIWPPPSPHVLPESLFQGREGGCISWTPPRRRDPPPPENESPTPRKVLSGVGGWGCTKFGPVVQELSGNPGTFWKVYKCMAHWSTNRRRCAVQMGDVLLGFMGGVVQYKWEMFCWVSPFPGLQVWKPGMHWRPLEDRKKIVTKSSKQSRHYYKEDHKESMQGYGCIIEVLVFWRYKSISWWIQFYSYKD